MLQRKALVRRPGPRLAEGIVTHIEREPIDCDRAFNQWQNYVQTFQAHGWETFEVSAAPNCPDAVFIEDPVFVYGDLAILAASGAPLRREEVPGAEAAVRALGYRIARIEAPGTLDGGDILKHDGKVWVGLSDRTNQAGIEQLQDLLAEFGAEVIAVPLTKVLHLKSAITALPDGTIIGYPPLLDDPTVFESFLAVPEESGSHVVILDRATVLMAASAVHTQEILRKRGLEVVSVDISEFEKLEGCVTCLSVRLRGCPQP